MNEILLIVLLGIGALSLTFLLLIWMRMRQSSHADTGQVLREELRIAREDASRDSRSLREEVSGAQSKANETLVKTINEFGDRQSHLLKELLDDQKKGLKDVTQTLGDFEKTHQAEQEKNREGLERKFREIQESNERKLEEMRKTVDEKLQGTLERRLGESFKQVSERLEAVQKGLGEMQSLATGVGDLKRVLTNVKERGTWGEYQLGAILEEILAPGQFERNVRPRNSGESVEFAVKLPGRGEDPNAVVWLPIDAKFPKEDYERLMEAANRGDVDAAKDASKKLANEIQRCAKDICAKYISPPQTTDFAILFLPTEGLYAEVLRQPGLQDDLQRKHRVLVAGPTTLSAILNSLRIGFQTLAIEKRASEVWLVLGAVKEEFGKFGAVLDKVKRQLHTASKTIEESARRSRAMERRLVSVEQLPEHQAVEILGLSPDDGIRSEDEDLEAERSEERNVAETDSV